MVTAIAPLSVSLDPIMRDGPALVNKGQVLRVRNLVLSDGKLRNLLCVKIEFVVPPKPFMLFQSQHHRSGGNLNHAVNRI